MFLSRIRKENLSNLTYISPSVLWRPTTASLLQPYPLIISFPPHNYRQCRPSFLNPTAHFPHLNYTTPLPKIVEQIVNILPPTSLSISLSIPKPISNPPSPPFMQQPSTQITIFSQPCPVKFNLFLRTHNFSHKSIRKCEKHSQKFL